MPSPELPLILLWLLLANVLRWASRPIVERMRAHSPRWRTRSARQRRLLSDLPVVILALVGYAVILSIFGLPH